MSNSLFEQEIPYLIFTLNGNDYAVPLTLVQRVTRMKDVTAWEAEQTPPDNIVFEGSAVPLRNLREELGYPRRTVSETDRLIVINTSGGVDALLVDEVPRVESPPNEGTILFDEFGFHYSESGSSEHVYDN